MKIALISLGNHRCHAVHLLHALLEREGFDVRSFLFKSAPSRPTPEAIRLLVSSVSEHEPELIGMSLLSTYYKLACTVTRILRERSDATTIVWGGVHPTVRPEDCLKHADVVCIGEGEEAIVELARAQQAKPEKAVHPIKNLWFNAGDGIVRNNVRPLLQDLDSLPIPHHLCDGKVFIDGNRILNLHAHPDMVEAYGTMTSRGCPFACDYCANQFLRGLYRDKGPYVRRRTVAHVIEELQLARERFPNLQVISFDDDVFTFDEKWIEEFCAIYTREIGLPFFCNVHPNMVRNSRIKLLKDAGLRYAVMGIQSGSSRVREEFFSRRGSDKRILESARILRKHRLAVGYDFITENPFETDDDRLATIKLIAQLPRPFQLSLFSLAMFPGTKLTDRALRQGVIGLEDLECMSEKGYELYSGCLDLWREDKFLLWDVLYFLAARGVPARLLLRLSRNRFLATHIRFIARALRCLPIDYYAFPAYSVHNRVNAVASRLFAYGILLARGNWRFCLAKIKRRLLRNMDGHL